MDHPQHCQQLAEQIATETDEAKRDKLRDRFRAECQDDGIVTLSDEVPDTADSGGGGGPTPPPQPPRRP